MSKPPNEISNPIIPITTDKISYAVIGTASFPMYSGQAGQWKEKQPFLSWVFSCSYHSIKTALPQYRKKGSGWKKAEGELKRVGFVRKPRGFSTMPILFKREVPSWSEASSWLPFCFWTRLPYKLRRNSFYPVLKLFTPTHFFKLPAIKNATHLQRLS